GLLVLQMRGAVAVDFRGGGLKQPGRRHLAADEFADALWNQRIQPCGLDRNVPGLRRARYRREVVDLVRRGSRQQILQEAVVGQVADLPSDPPAMNSRSGRTSGMGEDLVPARQQQLDEIPAV